ncbi:MAG: antitoxin [Verrucomicrobiaceae bacterium]|nr:antitoxin [Verrucomicrobiaceae bacterium]
MQTKLTLRVEEEVIRKAKRIAQQKGTSVSRIFGEFINSQAENVMLEDFPPITSSMIGVIRRKESKVDESDHKKYLEEKYL